MDVAAVPPHRGVIDTLLEERNVRFLDGSEVDAVALDEDWSWHGCGSPVPVLRQEGQLYDEQAQNLAL